MVLRKILSNTFLLKKMKSKNSKHVEENNFLMNEFASHKAWTLADLNNPDEFLRLVCQSIIQIKGVKPTNLEDFNAKVMTNKQKGLLGVRVDCCGTISGALHSAKIYNEFGIKATFFINHNSGYFNFQDVGHNLESFFPNVSKKIVRKISKLGHEIGLHNDLLSYAPRNSDIESIFQDSIRLLRRASGQKILGSAAHNSAWSYGRENFEVFHEFGSSRNTLSGRFRMEDFGLKYEANFPVMQSTDSTYDFQKVDEFGLDPIRNKEFLVSFFLNHPHFKRNYDYEAWLLGKDRWIFVNYQSKQLHYPLDTNSLMTYLSGCQDLNGIIVIHPEYVSQAVDEQVFDEDMR